MPDHTKDRGSTVSQLKLKALAMLAAAIDPKALFRVKEAIHTRVSGWAGQIVTYIDQKLDGTAVHRTKTDDGWITPKVSAFKTDHSVTATRRTKATDVSWAMAIRSSKITAAIALARQKVEAFDQHLREQVGSFVAAMTGQQLAYIRSTGTH